MSHNLFTEEDNNKTIRMVIGETFTIELESNPTTGYTWLRSGLAGTELSDCTFAIQSKFNNRAPHDNHKNHRRLLVGAGGTMVLEVKALKAGKHTLSLAYGRPWVGFNAAAKRYNIHVEATA
ncbi:ICP, putative [Trypanosoma brucei gambiense DAL972]|uniref:Inhibitor of cysteine peptidase, putative n=2 Tax=Trypanosoma brucei TaxID=5691 RepID=C9ZWC6_TRYB9|nr:ICP, putative [Trypanosoma brucei gambiense DAL972]2CIO_B Chain B, INHIBITOR OF CYSTEINE PEPTIDASE [Trypanosoma brucei]CAD68976.1 inhibitor of cysteine peptidase [Trypanosoma brucei]CBH13715.1 ICP, putative [Trypanosoma brucei gambiense DAL972]|eukprot:XP_011775991.1 ICP, putative [Trypanosoma brucei gambiense DAL972]